MPEQIYFGDITEATVDEYADFLAVLIQEAVPTLNVRKGTVFYSYVLRPAAAAHAYAKTSLDTLRAYWNTAAVVADPDAADPVLLDRLLSNFNAKRNTGTAAVGQVEIVLSASRTTTVQAGTSFTASNGQIFQNPLAQTGAAVAAEIIDSTDSLLRLRADGNYSFLIDVTAQASGLAGNIPQGTSLTVSPEPVNLVVASAVTDFSGGSAADDNQTLVDRMLNGLASKVLASRAQASAFFRALVPSTTDVAVVGMQDSEMFRDQRSLLGSSNGGRVDVYLRSQSLLDTVKVAVTATDLGSNQWQAVINRDETAGAIVAVRATVKDDTASAISIVSQTWDKDFTGATDIPDIETAVEAAFSSLQKVTLVLNDVNNGGLYDVYMLRLPSIALAQGLCDNDDYQDPMADWLVKSVIPIVTSVSARVYQPTGATIDSAAVKAAVVSAVNGVSFSTTLDASIVVSAIQGALPAGAYVKSPIELIGQLWKPDRTSVMLKSGRQLTVPADYSQGVSYKTTAFFTTLDDVSITEETS